MDATGWPSRGAKAAWNLVGPEYFSRGLPESKLCGTTYWLRILAVGQHLAICGNCLGFKKDNGWPCSSGAFTTRHGEEEREKTFLKIGMWSLRQQVVSLDPDLQTHERIWVVNELGEELIHDVHLWRFKGRSDVQNDCFRLSKTVMLLVKTTRFESSKVSKLLGNTSSITLCSLLLISVFRGLLHYDPCNVKTWQRCWNLRQTWVPFGILHVLVEWRNHLASSTISTPSEWILRKVISVVLTV